MDAIVLTCDKYRQLTEHMIFQYDRLWPDHTFRFLIPFQHERGADCPKLKFIPTEPSIRNTVLTLLSEFDDEDWVYWAIDDNYPITLDVPRIKQVERWILTQPAINGVLLCRCGRLRKKKYLTDVVIIDDYSNKYFERRDYERIWIHQFIRVKPLRELFYSFPDVQRAKEMDELKRLPTVPKPNCLFVRDDTLAIFGESTSRGVLTLNCFESILRHKLRLPRGRVTLLGPERFMASKTFGAHIIVP